MRTDHTRDRNSRVSLHCTGCAKKNGARVYQNISFGTVPTIINHFLPFTRGKEEETLFGVEIVTLTRLA
jgi:hypothetical protein